MSQRVADPSALALMLKAGFPSIASRTLHLQSEATSHTFIHAYRTPRMGGRRMRTAWTCSLVALLLCGCGDRSVSAIPSSERDRALAVAEDIVNGMARHYAETYHDGAMRAFAVDPGRLGRAYDPETHDYVSAPALEDALRSVAEQFSSDQASWLIGVDPLERIEIGSDSHYVLLAHVVDYRASHCCPLVAARLARDDDGWVVLGVDSAGYVDETEEFRRERLARRATALR